MTGRPPPALIRLPPGTARRRNGVALLLAVLVSGGVLLGWQIYTSMRSTAQFERLQVVTLANTTASQIENQLRDLRRSLQLFADSQVRAIGYVAAHPDDAAARRALFDQAGGVFPAAYALGVADQSGRLLVGGTDPRIDAACRQDLRHFANAIYAPDVDIHGHGETAHFDLAVHVDGVSGPPLILLVSFAPELMAQSLASGQLPGYRVLLLRSDQPGQIEATALGVPGQSGAARLSPAELAHASARVPVPGTLGEVVVLQDPAAAPLRGLRLTTLWPLALLLAVGAIALRRLRRSEHRLAQQNDVLSEQTATLQRDEERLRDLHEITSAPGGDFDTKMHALLALGCDAFGMEIGILACIEDLRYEICHVVSPIPELAVGTVFDLRDTYCQVTLRAGRPVAFPRVADSELARHPAYQKQKLEAYLAAPLYIGEKLFGTLSFSSRNPAARAFTSADIEFLKLTAQWVSVELAQRTDRRALARQRDMLGAISRAQSHFIADTPAYLLFDTLLQDLLQLSESEFGFIAEVLHAEDGAPYLKTLAVTNIGWDEATLKFYAEHVRTGMEFRRLDTLFGAGLRSGEVVIANDPARDPRRGGLPHGHPPLQAYLGIPVYSGERMTGMVGLANRDGGYDQRLVDEIRPITVTCGSLINAYRAEKQLRESHALQEAVMQSTSYLLIATDSNGTIMSFNPAAEAALGYSAEEMIGRLSPAAFHDRHEIADRAISLSAELGETIAPGFEVFVAKARRGLIEERVWTYVRKDGNRFPVSLSVSALRDPDGLVTGFLGVAKDISVQLAAEAALRDSEERYRSLIAAMQEGIMMQDANGKILTANSSAERILGLSQDQLTGRHSVDPLWHTVHEDGTPFPGADHPAMVTLRTGKPCTNVVMGVYKPDGTASWISVNTQPMCRPRSQTPYAVVSSFQDITARKEATEFLRQSKQRLAEAQRIAQLGNWEWNIADGGAYWSDETFRIFGHEAQAFQPSLEAFLAQVHPDDVAQIEQGVQNAMRNHKPFAAEYRIVLPNGDIRVLYNRGEVQCGVDGKPLRLSGTVQDVTEQRQAQAELNRFKSTLDRTLDCVFMFEPDTLRFFYVNQGATEQVGYSEDELMRMTPVDLKPLYDEAQFRKLIAPLIGGEKESMTFETIHQHRQGKQIQVEVFLQYVAPSGEAARFVAIVRDVTERKKIERMKSEFVSTVSHELRTPLTSIRGSLGLLTGGVAGELPPQGQSLIEIAHNNSERLLRLINDILDISKMESGKMEFHFCDIALRPFLEQAVTTNHFYGAHYDVNFVITECAEDLRVRADADRLMQVMNNLLSNAAKFSPPGGSVRIEARRNGSGVRISVADRGRGIPDAFRDRVFERFAQADASDARVTGGTGLGLSISKAIVEHHGGQISLSSEENRGTTFFVDLPA